MMQDVASHRDPFRYRLYYRLMDFCLLVYALFIATAIYVTVMDVDIGDGLSAPMIALRVLVGATTLLLGTLLVLARFMRDEYAELIWQRTVSVLVKVAVVAPLLILIAGWLTWITVGPDDLPAAYALQFEEVAIIDATRTVHGIFILLFVSIFQFLRWRDSR